MKNGRSNPLSCRSFFEGSISASIAMSTGSFSASARVACARATANGTQRTTETNPIPASFEKEEIRFIPPLFHCFTISLVHCPQFTIRCSSLCARNRQDRRPRRALRLPLRLHLAHQHCRSHGAHRNRSRLRAAFAVEHFTAIARGHDPLHR